MECRREDTALGSAKEKFGTTERAAEEGIERREQQDQAVEEGRTRTMTARRWMKLLEATLTQLQ